MLPSGTWVRGKLPTAGTLLRRGLLPGDLVAVAIKAADPAWLTAARIMSEDEKEQAARYLALLVDAFPRHRWDADASEWVPLVDIDELAEEDIDPLENVVLRLVTPAEQTALSRLGLGLPDDEEEVEGGIASLAEFRGDTGSPGAGTDEQPLEPVAEPDDGPVRPRRGVRARRGAGGGRDDR